MRSDLHSWSLRQLAVDREEDRTDVGGSPLPRLHGLVIMSAVVLAQCACCSRLLLPHPWCSRHLARLRFAGGIGAGRPWATGKGLRCDGSRSTAAQWARTMPREPATTTLNVGTTSSNAALISKRSPPLIRLVQEISQERRGTIKTRQAFDMTQANLPSNQADVQAMAWLLTCCMTGCRPCCPIAQTSRL